MKSKIIFVVLFALITGCEKRDYPLPDINQLILFQSEYINFAWVYVHSGILIDSSGNVRGYKLPKIWHFPDTAGYISLSDMNENIGQLDTSSFKIKKDTLLKYFNKLKNVAMSQMTKPVQVMADAGVHRYSGFLYDSKTKKYNEVLIRQSGDVYIENKSQDAKEIYNWMINLYKTKDK
jgi:hypothetical protein